MEATIAYFPIPKNIPIKPAGVVPLSRNNYTRKLRPQNSVDNRPVFSGLEKLERARRDHNGSRPQRNPTYCSLAPAFNYNEIRMGEFIKVVY